MVTVKQFLDVGFELTVGDSVNKDGCSFILNSDELVKIWNTRSIHDEECFINGVVWRKNTGVQPVGDGCWIEIKFSNGHCAPAAMADGWNWEYKAIHWKPSLKHLEQQMNTKTALEMSERDIENYADSCDVERELKESEEVVWESGDIAIHDCHDVLIIGWHPHHPVIVVEDGNGIFTTSIDKLSKPETPEEKAARERDEEIKSLMKKWGHEDYEMNKEGIVYTVIEQMLDEGYRK